MRLLTPDTLGLTTTFGTTWPPDLPGVAFVDLSFI